MSPYRNLELENRKAGILPPAFGRGCMLKLPERTGAERLDRLTKFKLFENGNVMEPSSSIPKANNQATSRSRKTLRKNDHANDTDCSTGNHITQLSPLLANDALARAVSQVQLPMDGWEPLHIFKLFVVLVDPPPDLDLSAIEGLHGYLAELRAEILALVQNGIRETARHCWWALLSKLSIHNFCTFYFYIFTVLCDDSDTPRKRADWVPILGMLRKAKKRLINWGQAVSFPIAGGFPKSRHTFRDMVSMFFNPDPACRLRLVAIEGMSQDLFDSCYGTDIIIQGPISDDTPIIIKPEVLGGVCLACTAACKTVRVDYSTVLQWSRPLGAVHGPDPTPHSAIAAPTAARPATDRASSDLIYAAPHSMTSVGLLPTTQRLSVPPSDPLPLSFDHLDAPTGPRHFDPSDPSFIFPISSESVFDAAANLYENDVQDLMFSPLAPLESTSTFIPPSNMAMFNPHHARTDFAAATAMVQGSTSNLPRMSHKRGPAPAPAHDERGKRRKFNGLTSGLPAANQGPTNAIIPPIPIPSFDRPERMSKDEYVKLLQAKLAAEL